MAGNVRFTSYETLAVWLATTPQGRAIVREVLLGNEDMTEEMRERALPTYCVVEYLASGPTVIVYGPRHLRAKVVEQPLTMNTEQELTAERQVEDGLPLNHKDVYWPSMKRVVTAIRHETVVGRERRVADTAFNLALIKALQ